MHLDLVFSGDGKVDEAVCNVKRENIKFAECRRYCGWAFVLDIKLLLIRRVFRWALRQMVRETDPPCNDAHDLESRDRLLSARAAPRAAPAFCPSVFLFSPSSFFSFSLSRPSWPAKKMRG